VARLVQRGFARAIEPGPVRRGRLYHVHHKPLYEAIAQPDNRNRRLQSIGRMDERVMILETVLSDRRCWLTLAKIDHHAEAVDELDVAASCRLANAFCPRLRPL
jgi:hypothetical protein